jgi:hypothetical protein
MAEPATPFETLHFVRRLRANGIRSAPFQARPYTKLRGSQGYFVPTQPLCEMSKMMPLGSRYFFS